MKNMKVALISFHNAYNYGACLQAYALQEAVSETGAECEYIDYINKRRAEGYKINSINSTQSISERRILPITALMKQKLWIKAMTSL